ncbi:hypothetical protein DY000_02011964 [Brassica cretica]|uniref:Uncharacterized protein n=1 Tax=Brassica cretica TaxID=69181 RepID=A0ABQ7CW11_BRACR|nr:hypothetical protein DY000_02011964 [Brassica cretica]
MGHDYSYSHLSESEEYGGETADSIYSETEDLIRRDQAEIRYNYVSRFSILLNPRLSLDFRRHATVEMRARDIHTLQLAEKVEALALLSDYETQQKLDTVEKMVCELAKKKSRFTNGFEYLRARFKGRLFAEESAFRSLHVCRSMADLKFSLHAFFASFASSLLVWSRFGASSLGCEFAVEPSTIFFSVWGDWFKDDAVVSIFGFFSCEDVTSFVLVDGLSWVHECPCVRTFDPLRRFALLEFQGLPCASVMLRVVILDVSVVSLVLRFNSSYKLLLWKGSCVFCAFSFGFVSLGCSYFELAGFTSGRRLHFWKDVNSCQFWFVTFVSIF